MSTSYTWQTLKFPTCNVCGSEFLILDLLIDHCKEQHKNMPYVCEHCGRADKYLSDFKRHQVMHTGERPHACQVCGDAFGQKFTLKTHMKRHAENTYYCEECKNSFKSEEEFERHKPIHAKEKVVV
ncbi:hypothetical protein CDAR_477281 [Caerostris darwini]|uniref:C2H2-type domain-containing protein n=1 Tax=Caerostris darwini TaxID=1538125 RepID=A0AAV4UYC2_9ARAC|nr:hypothetical protein CDAR_477281 [Caerostris darwini]